MSYQRMKNNKKIYDVAIIGAGVTGTSLLYTLSKYTNVKSMILLEKYLTIAAVNSQRNNNSQTLHFGDIETNYSLEKAAKVKEAAELVAAFVETTGKDEGLFNKTHKMRLESMKSQSWKKDMKNSKIFFLDYERSEKKRSPSLSRMWSKEEILKRNC